MPRPPAQHRIFPLPHPQGAFDLRDFDFTGYDDPLICFCRVGRGESVLEHTAGILPPSLTSPRPCSRTAWVPEDCSGVRCESQLLGTNGELSRGSPVHPWSVVPGQLAKASPTYVPLSYILGQKEREKERFLYQPQTPNLQRSPALTPIMFWFQNHIPPSPPPNSHSLHPADLSEGVRIDRLN